MAKKGKFDRSCYIPNQGKYSKPFWDAWKAEQEGMTEEFKNRKKQLKRNKK